MSDRCAIYVVAGEPSGDALGASLIAALRRASGADLTIAGVGGPRMAALGVASLFDIGDLAVMGFIEVLPRIPTILERLRETATDIERRRPAVVVTIDSPGFTLRLARRIRPLGIPMVHYVAPQLWAWKPGRARKLAGLFDRILTILPFEESFFAPLGIATTYVGHPAIEAAPVAAGPIAAELGLEPGRDLVAMLAGSRRGLVQRMLPIYRDVAATMMHHARPPAFVMACIPATESLVRAATDGWPVPVAVVSDDLRKRRALAAASVAVVTSGTATLELALGDTPMVVAYRTGRITGYLARRWVTVDHVSLPNLIAGRRVVPELLLADCTATNIAAAVAALLADDAARAAQRRAFAEIRAKLGADGVAPSDRAAAVVLAAMRRSH